MKKRFLLSGFLIASFLIPNMTFGYASQTQKFISAFDAYMKPMSVEKKFQYFDSILAILNAPRVRNNAKYEVRTLVSELKDWITISKNILSGAYEQDTNLGLNNAISFSGMNSYQTLPNIDFDKVRNAWLSWHNTLRKEKGIKPLEYNSDLERSANIWASYLASNSITNGTHARLSTDGYYNYNSIKEWFGSLGIFFQKESGGKAAFSESVGYRVYKCSSKDCTQNLIDVTRKIFDGYLNEGESGAHYKAIVMPHFSKIGIGFQVDPKTNYVFTVIHYAEKLIER